MGKETTNPHDFWVLFSGGAMSNHHMRNVVIDVRNGQRGFNEKRLVSQVWIRCVGCLSSRFNYYLSNRCQTKIELDKAKVYIMGMIGNLVNINLAVVGWKAIPNFACLI